MTSKNVLFSCIILFIASPLYAADIPTTVEGAEQFDAKMCIAQYRDQCINSVCMTSEELDCSEKCEELAIDKCKEKAEE